jgi:Spy/CpxP family protein refolding chaperone
MKLLQTVSLFVTAASIGCWAPVFAQDASVVVNAPAAQENDDVPPSELMMNGDDEPSFFAITIPGEDIAMGFPGMSSMDNAAGMGDFGFGHGFAGLNLTDDQYEKLFAIKREGMIRMAAGAGQMMTAHMNLHDLLVQPTLDKAKILAAQNNINTLKTANANARMEQTIAMMSVLTPEQRAELHKRMVHRVVDGMGPMGRMGMGKRGGWEHHMHGGHAGPGGHTGGPGHHGPGPGGHSGPGGPQ